MKCFSSQFYYKFKNVQAISVMSKTKLQRIQQLSCLGLEQRPFILAVLHELHDVVSSHANSFHWVDERCQVTNVYDESPDAMSLLPVYLHEYLNKGERDAVPATSEMVANARGVVTTAEAARPNYKKSIFYNEFLRPTGHHHAAATVIEQNGVRLGLLMLHRDNETEFSTVEKHLLEGLTPYIAHGLTTVRKQPLPLVDGEDIGMVILDQANRVKFASPRAQQALVLSQHNTLSGQSVKHGKMALPAEVVGLAKRLRTVFQSGVNTRSPPVLTTKNHWGEFVFRAHWLDGATGDATDDGLIGITIHHREPIAVRLFRRSKRLGISPKQIQIGSLLAGGLSYGQMARDLGVSQHTVIDHVRKLFDKLGARNRSELLMKLLSS